MISHSKTQIMGLVFYHLRQLTCIFPNIFCVNLKGANIFCEKGSQVRELYPPLAHALRSDQNALMGGYKQLSHAGLETSK